MTFEEFLACLKSVSHKTNVRRWLKGDTLDGSTCPITCVCKSMTSAHFPVDRAEEAASKIGMSKKLAKTIMECADRRADSLSKHKQSVRRKLLTAVNLDINKYL